MNPSGFLGVLSEPLLLILAIYAIKTFFLRSVFNTYGLSVFIFIVCGVLPFYSCTRVAFMGLTFPNKYENTLVSLPYIQEVDLFVSSGLNQARISLAVFLVVLYTEYIRVGLIINNILLAVSAIILACLIGIGLAINISILSRRFPPIRFPSKILVRRVLFWTSGLFYSLNSLPMTTARIISFNPLIHVELTRYSIKGDYPIENISIDYLINSAIILLGLAFIQSSMNTNYGSISNDKDSVS